MDVNVDAYKVMDLKQAVKALLLHLCAKAGMRQCSFETTGSHLKNRILVQDRGGAEF
jgi:hypothetical protein